MLTIDYFKKIMEISKIFSNIEYNRFINILNENKDNIHLIFKKKINKEFKYEIFIHNDYEIDVKIPIKNSNYKYSTKFNDINSVYNYLCLHINSYDKSM